VPGLTGRRFKAGHTLAAWKHKRNRRLTVMITLNQSELSIVAGGDKLDDYINNPYLNPLGGIGGSFVPSIPVSGGLPGGMPSGYPGGFTGGFPSGAPFFY
jgi:hypothetical protein